MSFLDINNLSKQFGDEHVLTNINLQLGVGKVMALLGKSGSGKSTLLKCINQLEIADAGSITIDEQAFTFGSNYKQNKKDLKQLRHNVGMVFQHFCLWPHLTVLQNLTLAPKKLKYLTAKQAEEKAMSLLSRFELADKASAKPGSLSGGQQQRVSIARSLMLNPALMLFDEPTSALDPEMTQEVLRLINELKKDNITLLISTHEIGFAKSVADEIAFIHQGNILEQGGTEIIDAPSTKEFTTFLTHTYH
jgi:ABC-type polar amino acid transport system ATPase subunit